MNRWIKPAAVLAVAAIVAGLSGGAGATNASTRAAPADSKGVARSAASTAAAQRGLLLRVANLETVAGAKRYLRAIGVNPRGVVIQRGVHNYAGPSCPGAGWSCTSTAHPVVQVARRGGKNSFLCTTGRCAVVQATRAKSATRTSRSLTAAAATNTATCNKTTGLIQSCSISQNNPTGDNVAIVVERAFQASSLAETISATVSAQITQQTSGSNSNQACVYQNITETNTPTNAKKGVAVNTTLDAQQSVLITQDAAAGGNTVQSAAAPPATPACVSGPLTQTQTLTTRAKGTAAITQNENAAASAPYVDLTIKQNQGAGLGTATGQNTAAFSQTSTMTASASTPNGPVTQTQGSANGGIQAQVNQFSHGLSTATASQTETQCEHAQASGSPTCTTGTPPAYSLTQTQYGPISQARRDPPPARRLAYVRKGPCCSTQADNDQDTFTINQRSTQNNDTGQTQTNTVQADCSTSGNCTATQTTQINGQPPTTNTQSGQNVNTSINCTGTTCSTPIITFDGSPGTNAPPSTLGPYTMRAFGPDPQPLGEVSGVSDPAGTISFDPRLHHDTVPNGGWNNWSHGYTGDVYDTCFDNGFGCTAVDPSHVRITLPAGTKAFYFYSEANAFNTFTLQATAQDGTTSGPVQVTTPGGAKYFGFYGTGGATLAHIDVTANDPLGFAVGEFGINPSAVIP